MMHTIRPPGVPEQGEPRAPNPPPFMLRGGPGPPREGAACR